MSNSIRQMLPAGANGAQATQCIMTTKYIVRTAASYYPSSKTYFVSTLTFPSFLLVQLHGGRWGYTYSCDFSSRFSLDQHPISRGGEWKVPLSQWFQRNEEIYCFAWFFLQTPPQTGTTQLYVFLFAASKRNSLNHRKRRNYSSVSMHPHRCAKVLTVRRIDRTLLVLLPFPFVILADWYGKLRTGGQRCASRYLAGICTVLSPAFVLPPYVCKIYRA